MNLGQMFSKIIAIKNVLQHAFHLIADDLEKAKPAITTVTTLIPGARAAGIAANATITLINEVDDALSALSAAPAPAVPEGSPPAPVCDPTKEGLTVTLSPECMTAFCKAKEAVANNPPVVPPGPPPQSPTSAPVV